MTIPAQIGRYEVKSQLGRGGMATVLRGYDPRFKRDVAIKVLPRALLHDPAFRGRFEREAETIASLEHPAIVPVYDFGEEDGQPYLVMRYMSGGSLEDVLQKGPLSPTAAARVIRRLAPALDEAHAQGLVHRDLKPGNILFDQRDDPYLSDFGIVKLQGSSAAYTGSGIIGTPAYMSPEQARGDEVIDGRSDIYALGAILFEMLTGRLPYNSDTPMGVALMHITEPVPRILDLRADLPPEYDEIIARAMAKAPTERYQTAGALAAALEALTQGQPEPAPSAPGGPTAVMEPADRTESPTPAAAAMEANGRAVAIPEAAWLRRAPMWAFAAGGIAIFMALFFLFGSNGSPGAIFAPPTATPSQTATIASTATASPTPKPSPTASAPPAPTSTPTPEPMQVFDLFAALGTALLNDIALHPQGGSIAIAAGPEVWLYDLEAHKALGRLAGHAQLARSVAWSPDGARLASSSLDGAVLVWDASAALDTGAASSAALFQRDDFADAVNSVAWSPDGARLAMAGNDGAVWLGAASQAAELQALAGHERAVRAVAWSESGAQLASGGLDRTVRIWDVTTGEQLLVLEGHASSVNAVAWSPDDAWLASGSDDASIRLWDVSSGEARRVLEGHLSSVNAVAWSPDGAWLASGSNDGTVRVWDAASGEELQALEGHADAVVGVAWLPNGEALVSASLDGTLRLWRDLEP